MENENINIGLNNDNYFRKYYASKFLTSLLTGVDLLKLDKPTSRLRYIRKSYEMADLFIRESIK